MLVSVMIITYNRKKLLEKAIQSVLNQSYTNLELIVLDDGSTDGTEGMVTAIKDSRVRYFWNANTGHVPTLRNQALAKCSGDCFAILDSDDFWHPDKLMVQLNTMNAEQTKISFTGYQEIDSNNGVLKTDTYQLYVNEISPTNVFSYLMRNKFVIYPSTFMFYRSCIEEGMLFDMEMTFSEHDFISRLLSGHKGSMIHDNLVSILKHSNNNSDKHVINGYNEFITTSKKLYAVQKILLSRFILIMLEMNYYKWKYVLIYFMKDCFRKIRSLLKLMYL